MGKPHWLRRTFGWSHLAWALGGALLAALWLGSDAPDTRAVDDEALGNVSVIPAAETSSTPPAAADRFYLGVLLPQRQIDVKVEVSGLVEEITVRPGDVVDSGTVLARIDVGALEHDLEGAQASLQVARAELERSRVELERAQEELRRREELPDLMSQEEIAAARYERDASAADLKSAEARVAEANARVSRLQDQTQRSRIKAPFGGQVAARYLDAGTNVQVGEPVIRLISSDQPIVHFAVPPEEIEALSEGSPVEVTIQESGRTIPASVLRIAPEIDAAARMVFVEAILDAPRELDARALAPGTEVAVRPTPTV